MHPKGHAGKRFGDTSRLGERVNGINAPLEAAVKAGLNLKLPIASKSNTISVGGITHADEDDQ